MTLAERLTCRVRDCGRHRAPDALVCDADLRELWSNRLHKEPDGSYTRRRTFPARETLWRAA